MELQGKGGSQFPWAVVSGQLLLPLWAEGAREEMEMAALIMVGKNLGLPAALYLNMEMFTLINETKEARAPAPRAR